MRMKLDGFAIIVMFFLAINNKVPEAGRQVSGFLSGLRVRVAGFTEVLRRIYRDMIEEKEKTHYNIDMMYGRNGAVLTGETLES